MILARHCCGIRIFIFEVNDMNRIPYLAQFTQKDIIDFQVSCGQYIRHLVSCGGPQPQEYEVLNGWFNHLRDLVRNSIISNNQIQSLWDMGGEPFSAKTMQGLVRAQLRGYAGDYEVIDRIYLSWVSPKAHLAQWDHFFHWQKASKAVRNRKDYFLNYLKEFETANSTNENLAILNVGSGSGRDIQEYFQNNPDSKWLFNCLDNDPEAVAFAQSLCKDLARQVRFQCSNVLRFKLRERYDMIWAGGVFDYFNDRSFIFMIKRLSSMLAPRGELIIGNFSMENPSRGYMECGNWFLHHRSENQLVSLARECNIPHQHLRIDKEPEGVNLFLHILS